MRCVISDAHEVVLATETGPGDKSSERSEHWPSTKANVGKYFCVSCGKRGGIDDMFNGGCRMKIELESSGWRPMTGTRPFNYPLKNDADYDMLTMLLEMDVHARI